MNAAISFVDLVDGHVHHARGDLMRYIDGHWPTLLLRVFDVVDSEA